MRKLSKSEKITLWIVGIFTFITITGERVGMLEQSYYGGYLLTDLIIGIPTSLLIVMFIFWIIRKVKKKDRKAEIK